MLDKYKIYLLKGIKCILHEYTDLGTKDFFIDVVECHSHLESRDSYNTLINMPFLSTLCNL